MYLSSKTNILSNIFEDVYPDACMWFSIYTLRVYINISYINNLPVTGEFPSQMPVTPSFDVLVGLKIFFFISQSENSTTAISTPHDVFFDLRLNKRLSKQSWGWWAETPSSPLWRHCNEQHCKFDLCYPWRPR